MIFRKVLLLVLFVFCLGLPGGFVVADEVVGTLPGGEVGVGDVTSVEIAMRAVGSAKFVAVDAPNTTPLRRPNAVSTGSVGGVSKLRENLKTIGSPVKAKSVPEVIGLGIKGVLSVIGSLALAMFVFGGLTWMTAAGAADQVTKGKNIIIWAVIGLVVVFSSYIMVGFVIGQIGGGLITPTPDPVRSPSAVPVPEPLKRVPVGPNTTPKLTPTADALDDILEEAAGGI